MYRNLWRKVGRQLDSTFGNAWPDLLLVEDRTALRWVDRDEHPELASRLRINGGNRVPVAVFMNEFFEPVSILGDRTLTRYRAIAAQLPQHAPAALEAERALQPWLLAGWRCKRPV